MRIRRKLIILNGPLNCYDRKRGNINVIRFAGKFLSIVWEEFMCDEDRERGGAYENYSVDRKYL